MRLAPFQPSIARRDAPSLHRSASLALVALLHILLLLLLLRLAPPPEPPPEAPLAPISVHLIANAPATPTRKRAAEAPSARVAPPAKVPPSRPDPPDAEPAPVSSIWSQVIPMTREQMAAADIGRAKSLPTAKEGNAAGGSGTTHGQDTDDSSGPGTGPNGETLYNAQWYRRPTHAELSTYLPRNKQGGGWGMIACQTVANYRVENCQEIGQSPGSGLAGAVRQAAWQFRVLPPRIGGRPMVGSWVRIRIDYTVSGPE